MKIKQSVWNRFFFFHVLWNCPPVHVTDRNLASFHASLEHMYLLYPTTWRFIIICSHCFVNFSLSIYLDAGYYGMICYAISIANLTNRLFVSVKLNLITRIPVGLRNSTNVKNLYVNCKFEHLNNFGIYYYLE